MHENATPPSSSDEVVDAVLTASRVLVAIAARSLADAGEQVTLTQYRALVVLASRGPQSVAALAEAVAVTPPTASRLADRLVRKSLVRRRADRHDRRQVRVGLTEAGRSLIDAVTARRREEITLCLQPFSPDDQRRGRRRAAPPGGERRGSPRAGLEQRMGPVKRVTRRRASPSGRALRRARAAGSPALVSQEVGGARRRHRPRRRTRRRRLLRGPGAEHALLPRLPRRLPRAVADR